MLSDPSTTLTSTSCVLWLPSSTCFSVLEGCRTHLVYTEVEGPRNLQLPARPPMLTQRLWGGGGASAWTTDMGRTYTVSRAPLWGWVKVLSPLHALWWMGFAWHHTPMWAFPSSLCVGPIFLFPIFSLLIQKIFSPQGNWTHYKVCLTTYDILHVLLARKAARLTPVPPMLPKATNTIAFACACMNLAVFLEMWMDCYSFTFQ